MRTPIALALAILLAAPALAAAESLAVTEAAAISSGIEASEVARVRGLFETALRQTGIEITSARKWAGAEFVASLTLAKEGAELVLTAQVSRLKLDLWATRAQVRVQDATAEAIDAAVQDLAGQIDLAVRTAPARNLAQPSSRPPARKLQAGLIAPDAAE